MSGYFKSNETLDFSRGSRDKLLSLFLHPKRQIGPSAACAHRAGRKSEWLRSAAAVLIRKFACSFAFSQHVTLCMPYLPGDGYACDQEPPDRNLLRNDFRLLSAAAAAVCLST